MIIDTNVQPHFRYNAEIRRYLPDAHQLRAIPDVEQQWYQAPAATTAKTSTDSTIRVRIPRPSAATCSTTWGVDYAVAESVDARQHRRLPAQHQHLRCGQRLAARPLARTRHHRPIPGHHPGQPRRPPVPSRRSNAWRTSQAGASRCPDAVARAVRQADVRTHLGGRRGPRPFRSRVHINAATGSTMPRRSPGTRTPIPAMRRSCR